MWNLIVMFHTIPNQRQMTATLNFGAHARAPPEPATETEKERPQPAKATWERFKKDLFVPERFGDMQLNIMYECRCINICIYIYTSCAIHEYGCLLGCKSMLSRLYLHFMILIHSQSFSFVFSKPFRYPNLSGP